MAIYDIIGGMEVFIETDPYEVERGENGVKQLWMNLFGCIHLRHELLVTKETEAKAVRRPNRNA